MRTTVNIDDHLLVRAKRRARELGVSLGEFLSSALRRELSRRVDDADRPRIPVFNGGGGMRPGVDASSTRGLLEALDKDQPLEKLR